PGALRYSTSGALLVPAGGEQAERASNIAVHSNMGVRLERNFGGRAVSARKVRAGRYAFSAPPSHSPAWRAPTASMEPPLIILRRRWRGRRGRCVRPRGTRAP